MAEHLRSSVYFQRHRGRDWLLLNSFYWVKTVLGDELGALALQVGAGSGLGLGWS